MAGRRYRLSPLSIRDTANSPYAPLASATVTVYKAGGVIAATCYADTTTGTPLANSQTTTNSAGYFEFFIDSADYTSTQRFKIKISKTGYTDTNYDNLIVLPDLSGVTDPWVDVRAYGAVGDGDGVGGGTDDSTAFTNAIAAAVAAGGGIIKGKPGAIYKISSGITIDANNVYLDMPESTIDVAFASGIGITVGDGVTVRQRCGVRNVRLITSQTGTGLHGIKYTKNVRHGVRPENITVDGFKGNGVEFAELNWNIQSLHGLYITNCGVNLKLGPNSNAMNLIDCSLIDATTYNVTMDGSFAVNFIGGINQGAGTAGVSIVSTTSACKAIGFRGVYFEDNGASHIVADGAVGITVGGCYLNGTSMTADSLVFTNCDGITILPNTPVNISANNLVNTDANCSVVYVAPQAVTTLTDQAVTGTLDNYVGMSAHINQTGALPTPTTVQDGTLRVRRLSNRDILYFAARVDSGGTRRFEPLAGGPRKVAAAASTNPQALSLLSGNVFDYTIGQATQFTAPTQPIVDGEEITVLMKQNAVGGFAITWAADFITDYSDTGNTANKYASVSFRYSADRTKWIQTGKLGWT